jgi:hypothetical protein
LPYISIWYFFWLQIARWLHKYKNYVVWRSTLNVTGQNDQKLTKFEKFHIFWPYLTSSGWNWPSNNQIFTFLKSVSNLRSKKVPYRYIGQLQCLTFIWEFSIFKASGLPINLKKNKYADIDFTSHHNFFRVRRDQFLQNCKKKPTLIYSYKFSCKIIAFTAGKCVLYYFNSEFTKKINKITNKTDKNTNIFVILLFLFVILLILFVNSLFK